MLPSLRHTIDRLSKLQREFLIDHVDGLRRFADQPVENATREGLLARRLIRYDPPKMNRLGIPNGTVLTDDGREALSYILGDMADKLTHAIEAKENVIDENRESALFNALVDAAKHWRTFEYRQKEVDANCTVKT